MAPKGTKMGLVLTLVVMLWGETMAQSGCTTALMGLVPCLTFVSGNSSTPSSSCCSQLSNVVEAQPRCLCLLVNGGGANLGISINQTLALSLPGACNVETPPVSKCNGVANAPSSPTADSPTSNSPPEYANAPSSSTADSPTSNYPPESSSDEIPEAPSSTSKPTLPTIPLGGSKSVPSMKADASDGRTIRAPFNVLVFALFTVWCASTVTTFLT